MKKLSKTSGCYIILFLLIVMVSGCASLQRVIEKPDITVTGMTPKNISLTDVTMLFTLQVRNPNPVNIHLKRVEYGLLIGGKKFGEGVLNENITLKPEGSEEIHVPVRLSYSDLFDAVPNLIRADTVGYELSGFATVGYFKIPYRYQGKLEIPRIPRFF